MHQNQRRAEINAKFAEIFQTAPIFWSRAPGRVDLMGSHTDYNLGYVMTMTIDRDTWIAAAPRADRQARVFSMNLEQGAEFSLDDLRRDPASPWADYLRGMAAVFQAEGYPLTGFNALVHSTVPFASGLSSSAALEMATGVLFQQLGGFQIDPVRLALLGQKAENHFVGVNSGILDQYSSSMGRAGSSLLLDCRDLTSQVTPIAPGLQVMICDTRFKRSLVGSEYDERRAQCEEGVRRLQAFDPSIRALRDVSLEFFNRHRAALPEVVARRCQFILEENQRVLDLASALSAGDSLRLRQLFEASFAGARDLYEISVPAMQQMVAGAQSAPGIIAVRQAGAGFGGCLVALVEAGRQAAFQAETAQAYQACSGIEPAIYPVRASDGAGPLRF